ncbi:hypothetical protein ACE38V_07830 [Cytobacillus sp. Hz8]|uniref:hypothetical protein n=1 Tax=Cytobacillus sp. Hz8 TaxID=3347168 RepID=UPI0035DC10BF
MTIKIQRLVNIALILLTWLTLPFMGGRNLKRFLPATIIIVLFEIINGMIGKRRHWWFFYNKPQSHLFGEFPYYIGPFFVNSLWILKWTFGNFKKFLLFNAILNFTFAFLISRFSRKIKYWSLDRINEFQFFLYYFYKALILYGVQILFERFYSQKAKRKFFGIN